MLQVRPPSRQLAVMSSPRSIFSRRSRSRDNHNHNNNNGNRDQDNYSHSQSNYYAGDGASSAFSVAGALAAVDRANFNNNLNSTNSNTNDNVVIRIPPFQVPVNQRLSPRADRWLYLFFSSCAAAASASLATPSSSSGGGFGGRSTGGGRSPAEQLALGMCGLSCVAACVVAAGFRYRPLRRWLTGSGCCHAKGAGKHVGGGGGCLCLRTGFTPEFQCAVVQLLLWTISSVILWDPRHSLATASTLGSISIVWNANLFFSTYLSFGLACLLFAELCTVRNVHVLGLLAAVEAEHQRGHNGGNDKKNAAHAKQSLNLNDMLVRQTHQQMLGVVPFHHRYPTHQKIDMAFLLLAMASLALLGLGLDQMLGPLCQSPSDPTTQRACNDSTLSLIFGILGLLLGTTHHLLSLSSRVQIRKFARGGCALRDVEPLLRANERRRNGLGAVFSAMTLLCFSLLVAFATGHRENDNDGSGSGSGNETARAGNLYFLSWICFGLSLYLCVKHLEVFTVPSSSYGRVVGADDVAWVQDAEYYGFYDPNGMRRLSKAKIAGVANGGAKRGNGGSGNAALEKQPPAKSSSSNSVETASEFSDDEEQDSDSPILYLPHTFDDSSSLGETYFDATWYTQQQQQQPQAPLDPQQQMPMPEYYGHGSPPQGRESPMRQAPPRPEPPQESPREPAAAAPAEPYYDDDMPFMYEIDEDQLPIPQQPPTAFRRDTSERLSLFNARNNSSGANTQPDPGRARERDTSSSSASPPSTQSGGSGIERVPKPFSDSSSSGRKKNLRDVDGFKMMNNKSRHFTELGQDSLAEIFSEESSGPYSNDHPPPHRQPPAASSSHGNSRGQSTGYASTVSGSKSSRGTRDRSATPSKSTSSPSRGSSSGGGKRRHRSAAKLHRSEGSIHQHPDDRHRNRSKASNSSSSARRNRRATMESGMSGGPPTLSADEDSYREGQGPPTVSASGGGEGDDDEEGIESVTQYVINGRPVRMNLNGSLDSMSMLSDPTVDDDPQYQQHPQQYNRPSSHRGHSSSRGHSTSSRRSPHSSSTGEENEAAAGMVDKLVMEALKQAHVARSNNIQRAERSRSGSRGGNSRAKSRSGSVGGKGGGGGAASRGGSKDKMKADSRQQNSRRSSTSKKSGSLHSFYSYGEMSSGTPMTNEGDDEAFAC